MAERIAIDSDREMTGYLGNGHPTTRRMLEEPWKKSMRTTW